MLVDVIIPVLNEAAALGNVLGALPRSAIRKIVVVDNGSTDGSGAIARELGAEVVVEPRRGYGRAVWAGILYLMQMPPDVVVFLDGDAADDPTELPSLLKPIAAGRADLVIGSRMVGKIEPGAMPIAQRLGNFLVPLLIRSLYRTDTTDLGPFRAIRWPCLLDLQLVDRNYGITVEMQVKAAKKGFRTVEVPVTYRPRIGESKISGNFANALKAAIKILWTTAKHAG